MFNKWFEKKQENGSYVFEGVRYALIEQAFFDTAQSMFGEDAFYTAHAVREDAVPDEYDCVPVYRVVWDILDDYDPMDQGEDCACDWDAPRSVELTDAEYMIDEERYI